MRAKPSRRGLKLERGPREISRTPDPMPKPGPGPDRCTRSMPAGTQKQTVSDRSLLLVVICIWVEMSVFPKPNSAERSPTDDGTRKLEDRLDRIRRKIPGKFPRENRSRPFSEFQCFNCPARFHAIGKAKPRELPLEPCLLAPLLLVSPHKSRSKIGQKCPAVDLLPPQRDSRQQLIDTPEQASQAQPIIPDNRTYLTLPKAKLSGSPPAENPRLLECAKATLNGPQSLLSHRHHGRHRRRRSQLPPPRCVHR
jgi:hypothetical protein